MRKPENILVGRPRVKQPLRISSCRSESNNKMHLREIRPNVVTNVTVGTVTSIRAFQLCNSECHFAR